MRIPLLAVLLNLIGCFVFPGCSQTSPNQTGDVILIGKDTFRLRIDTIRVKGYEKVKPISVHDGINPKYQILLENDSHFISNRTYSVGEKIAIKTYVRQR